MFEPAALGSIGFQQADHPAGAFCSETSLTQCLRTHQSHFWFPEDFRGSSGTWKVLEACDLLHGVTLQHHLHTASRSLEQRNPGWASLDRRNHEGEDLVGSSGVVAMAAACLEREQHPALFTPGKENPLGQRSHTTQLPSLLLLAGLEDVILREATPLHPTSPD